MTDDLVTTEILGRLRTTRFGPVDALDPIDSTQALLMQEGGPDGRVVVADQQTAGRGRMGRTWLSTPGTSLLFSVLLRGIAPEDAALQSLAAAVAVARAIESLGPSPALKWPNDVQISARKVCGILGELSPGGDYLVLGIGVNVRQSRDQLPPDVQATSLLLEGVVVRRSDLLASILAELESLVGRTSWMDEYRARCATIGSRVRVHLPGETFEGTAAGVRDDGALVVDGRAIVAGDVVHVG